MFQAGFLVEGRYQVTAKIGEGGMGKVWLAVDKRLNRTVVLKTIEKTETAYHEMTGKTFVTEWNMLKKLHHPGLPILFDVINRDDLLILVVEGSQVDARTDIYALGITLYELVTGEVPPVPFNEHKTIRQYNPELSTDFEQIIERCTQREPSQRFQSVQELKYALAAKHTDQAWRRNRIFKFLGIWKKEPFGSGSTGSEPDVTVSHVTEDFDMIRYNAKLLAHLQNESEH